MFGTDSLWLKKDKCVFFQFGVVGERGRKVWKISGSEKVKKYASGAHCREGKRNRERLRDVIKVEVEEWLELRSERCRRKW